MSATAVSLSIIANSGRFENGEHQFYPKFATMLLRFVLRGCVRRTDELPVKKKRDAVKKAINVACRAKLPPRIRFGCYHHPCASNQ